MDPEIYVFLPFSFISSHPPQGVWTNEEIRFNSPTCLEKFTKHEKNHFSLTWDDLVAQVPEACIIGYASATSESHPLGRVPIEFQQYLGIMGKEAADALPAHRPYNYQINLQEGSTAPWGPIYLLSKEELQVL